MRSVTALALFLFVVCPTLTNAQNLIPFPDFDTSSDLTNGWGNLGVGKVWSSVDVDASPSSGSLLMIHDLAPLTGILVRSACVAVTGGEAYAFGAWHFTQIFQPGSGVAQVQVQWYDSCGGTFLGQTVFENSAVEGVWTQIEGQATAPLGAAIARLLLLNSKSTGVVGEEREIFFDAAFLPEPNGLEAALTGMLTLTLLRRRRRARGACVPRGPRCCPGSAR